MPTCCFTPSPTRFVARRVCPTSADLFPDTDARYKDADSAVLLRGAVARARDEGWQIVNVDAVLVAQQPKISPWVEQMKGEHRPRSGHRG